MFKINILGIRNNITIHKYQHAVIHMLFINVLANFINSAQIVTIDVDATLSVLNDN